MTFLDEETSLGFGFLRREDEKLEAGQVRRIIAFSAAFSISCLAIASATAGAFLAAPKSDLSRRSEAKTDESGRIQPFFNVPRRGILNPPRKDVKPKADLSRLAFASEGEK